MIKRWLSPLLSGLVFGVGLMLAGMTQPEKVVGFLDVFSGNWDPSLAFVMGGAVLVFGSLQSRIRTRREPFWGSVFHVPERSDIDAKLVIGAALFGIGWGLAGYCPGPALTSVARGGDAWIFVAAMVAGMWLHAGIAPRLTGSSTPPAPEIPEPHTEAQKPALGDG